MPPDVKLQKLTDMMKLLNEGLTKAEFTKSFEGVIKLLVSMEERNRNAIASLQQIYSQTIAKMQSSHATAFSDLKGQVDQVFVGDKLAEMRKIIEDAIAKIQNGKDGPKGEKGDPGLAGKAGKDGSPDTPEQIKNKLESLADGKKLTISAIQDLQQKLDDLAKRIKQGGGTNFVVARGAIKLYDLSDQLDGNKKTFSLPSFWRVIDVKSSSTPNAFRPTTDYTTDASIPSLTFTSQIDAASTLAAGQTLLVEYAEP